jgi:acyl dehydratase
MGFMARRFESAPRRASRLRRALTHALPASVDFLRPVYSGELLRCELVLTELCAAESGALGRARSAATRLSADCVITNPKGQEVARVRTSGVIPRPFAEVQKDDPRARL